MLPLTSVSLKRQNNYPLRFSTKDEKPVKTLAERLNLPPAVQLFLEEPLSETDIKTPLNRFAWYVGILTELAQPSEGRLTSYLQSLTPNAIKAQSRKAEVCRLKGEYYVHSRLLANIELQLKFLETLVKKDDVLKSNHIVTNFFPALQAVWTRDNQKNTARVRTLLNQLTPYDPNGELHKMYFANFPEKD